MSQAWAREQARRSRKPKQSAPTPPSQPQQRSLISYTRLEHLQRVARAQHNTSSASNARLPEEAKIELENEWWSIVDEAMTLLNRRLTCVRCGRIHKAPDTMKMMVSLRDDMDTADVEDIHDVMIEGWKRTFEKIEKLYGEEMLVDGCGNGSASSTDPPHENVQTEPILGSVSEEQSLLWEPMTSS